MSGLISDSQYEEMRRLTPEVKLETMYEKVIQKVIDNDCDRALAMINRKKNNEGNKQYLIELKARVLWYKKTYDRGTYDALGEMYRSKVVFRFPVTYLLYGDSSHVPEGSDQLKIYRLGLEEAQKKDDEHLSNEFRIKIQNLEEIEIRKSNKSKKKRKSRMIIEEKKQEEEEEKKQEEEEVQIAVKDDEKELQNVVDKMAEHNISKEKYEVEIFPDCGKQFDFPFKFTMISKLGKHCYTGIQDTGKVEVEKSLVAGTKLQVEEFKALHYICSRHHSLLTVESVVQHPTDGTDLLVCEVVHTLNDFFNKEFQKLNGAKLTETLWWEHIVENFQRIFRDVIQGMIFLYLETDIGWDELSFNIFVTKSGKGRILPSMVKRTIGTKKTTDHIKQLKDAMRTVIGFPFNGVATNLELPLELRRFLNFEHSGCPPWFVINCPFFWTVEEKVQFVHELKMLIKLNAKAKWTMETCLLNAGMFAFWKKVPDGVYKKVLDYHERPTSEAEAEDKAGDESEHVKVQGSTPTTSKAGAGDKSAHAKVQVLAESSTPTTSKAGAGDKSAHAKVQATIGYHDRIDICRFFVAAYSHVNDYMYKNDRGKKIFKRAEIEEALSIYFPYFYVIMFECLCLDANVLGDEFLKMVSNAGSDFPHH